ncbi:MAG: hypothetical protein ACRCZF_23070, partial [Gemmataceae bacterium]
YTMIGGLLLFLVPLGLVAADLFGIPWLRENVLQRFQELPPAQQGFVLAGLLGIVVFVKLVLYARLIGGVKHLIREQLEPVSH